MLTLERKVGQSIMIGDGIEVYVAAVRGGAVKLAVRAPRNVIIYRAEAQDRIRVPDAQPSAAPTAGTEGRQDLRSPLVTAGLTWD